MASSSPAPLKPPPGGDFRPLAAADAAEVAKIDRLLAGRSRRGFFEKRFRAMARHPDDFIAIGHAKGESLLGFALAHVLNGEFGGKFPVAMLDAIGVVPEAQGRGIGRGLLAAVEAGLAVLGGREVRTQADWRSAKLLGLLAATGFALAPRAVLCRAADAAERLTPDPGDAAIGGHPGRELDFSDRAGDDFTALSRDRVPVRSLQPGDLQALIAIDKRITGRDRTAYYRRKAAEVLEESGVRVSLVAELDGRIAGFVMARVDFGEFGRAEPEGVFDTIAVDPAQAGRDVGTALISQLLANLVSLRVERIRTEVAWNNFALLGFLDRCGFAPAPRLSFARTVA